MGNTRTVVMSGHRVGGFAVRRSVRPYLTSSVAGATAGILAAGFVAGPPEVTVARTEVQGMQLIAIALPSTTPRPAMPMNSVRSQGRSDLSVILASIGADVTHLHVQLRPRAPAVLARQNVAPMQARVQALGIVGGQRDRDDGADGVGPRAQLGP